MMYTHFIGRIGKDGAKVINGNKGQFLSMDVATDIYTKGENKTLWIRVRSNRENHIKLAQYLTQGRVILVQGTLQEDNTWIGKDNQTHSQHVIIADSIDFVKIGKKKDVNGTAEGEPAPNPTVETPKGKPVQDAPNAAPKDKDGDAPF